MLLNTAKCKWTLRSENLIRKKFEKRWKPEYFPPKLKNRRVYPLTILICYFRRSQKRRKCRERKGIHIGKEKNKMISSVSIFPSILTMIISRFCIKSFICLSTTCNIYLLFPLHLDIFAWLGIDFSISFFSCFRFQKLFNEIIFSSFSSITRSTQGYSFLLQVMVSYLTEFMIFLYPMTLPLFF